MSYSLENLTGQFFLHKSCFRISEHQMGQRSGQLLPLFTHQVTTIEHAMKTLEQIRIKLHFMKGRKENGKLLHEGLF